MATTVQNMDELKSKNEDASCDNDLSSLQENNSDAEPEEDDRASVRSDASNLEALLSEQHKLLEENLRTKLENVSLKNNIVQMQNQIDENTKIIRDFKLNLESTQLVCLEFQRKSEVSEQRLEHEKKQSLELASQLKENGLNHQRELAKMQNRLDQVLEAQRILENKLVVVLKENEILKQKSFSSVLDESSTSQFTKSKLT